MSAVLPNEYTLQGGGLTFTYLKHNFLGQPYVSYTENGQTKTFSANADRLAKILFHSDFNSSAHYMRSYGTRAARFLIYVGFMEISLHHLQWAISVARKISTGQNSCRAGMGLGPIPFRHL